MELELRLWFGLKRYKSQYEAPVTKSSLLAAHEEHEAGE